MHKLPRPAENFAAFCNTCTRSNIHGSILLNERSSLARVRTAWWIADKILKLVSEVAVQAIDRQSLGTWLKSSDAGSFV